MAAEWYPIVDGSTYTCPIHGDSDTAMQFALDGEPSPDYRCYQCYRDNVINPNCEVVTRTPPP